MLLNTLNKIKNLLDNKLNLEDSLKEDILNFFKKYKKGMYLYASILQRKFHLSTKDIYFILDELEQEKILKSYYQFYCYNCSHTNREIYETFNQIPETFICENCGTELVGLENVIIFYKVIIDG